MSTPPKSRSYLSEDTSLKSSDTSASETLRFTIFALYLLLLGLVAWINMDVTDRQVELALEQQSRQIPSNELVAGLAPQRARVPGVEALGWAVTRIWEHAGWAAREALKLRRRAEVNRSSTGSSLLTQAEILEELVVALERQASRIQRLIEESLAAKSDLAEVSTPVPLEEKAAEETETVAEVLMRYASRLRQAGGIEQAAGLERRANQVLSKTASPVP